MSGYPADVAQPQSGQSTPNSSSLLRGSPLLESKPDFSCPICFGCYSSDVGVLLACGSLLCASCMREYCTNRIISGNVPVYCPFGERPATESGASSGSASHPFHALPSNEIEDAVGSVVFAKYVKYCALKEKPNLRECPSCGRLCEGSEASPNIVCGGAPMVALVPYSPDEHVIDVDVHSPAPQLRERRSGGASTPPRNYSTFAESHCAPSAGCGAQFCYLHSNAHPGRSCEEYSRALASNTDYALSEAAATASSKPCPHCNASIELAGGCDHVRCPACKNDFCYRCGRGGLTGKYARTCPHCSNSYLDHQYFRRWCCIMLIFSPFVLLISLIWIIFALLFLCCRWTACKQQFPRVKHRCWIVFYPVAIVLIISGLMQDDPMADAMQVPRAAYPYDEHPHGLHMPSPQLPGADHAV